jgi:proteic killer suppression protein
MNFKHKGLKRLFDKGDARKIHADHINKIRRILYKLDVARTIDEVDAPGFRLHALKGDLKGFWSVSVSGNWRIIFRFIEPDALDVDLIDYH